MTACFSLRLRLKVYSFKNVSLASGTRDTPFFMQRPTVSDFLAKTFKQRDRHLRWLFD
jgi:hypothetical protein